MPKDTQENTLPIAGEGKVKALEWKQVVETWPMEGMKDVEAVSDIGTYTISMDQPALGGTHYLWLAGNETDLHDSEHRNMSDARASAQADYAARISSPGKDGGQEPVLFVSEQQLPTCVGTYLPTRKHREGNFQMPLYTRPQPASTALVERLAAFDRDYPEFYWHVAKGKICAGEPLYGAIITRMNGTEIGHGESNVSAEAAFEAAFVHSGLPALYASHPTEGER